MKFHLFSDGNENNSKQAVSYQKLLNRGMYSLIIDGIDAFYHQKAISLL